MASPTSAGVFDWLASTAEGRESFERLIVPTGVGVHLVPPGSARCWDPQRVARLVEVLSSLDCPVVIDCGLRRPTVARPPDEVGNQRVSHVVMANGGGTGSALVEELCSSTRSVLVSSACYLAVRRAVQMPDAVRDTDGLVVVAEPGRALDAKDVASVTQLDLLATIERDPAAARCIDAGLFLHRPTRSLLRAVRELL